MSTRLRATAPATTANLGPGFDCLGAALDIELSIELGDGEVLPKRIQKAIRAGGGPEGPHTGVITSSIPQARGLGSSAACVAAGLLLGAALGGRRTDRAELLAAGTPIEGHPDNLAPALLGGVTLVTPDGAAMAFEPAASVRPRIVVPREQLKTDDARKALAGRTLEVAEAVANIARAAGLLAMLTGSAEVTDDRLLECTEDVLHQPPRMALMPRTADALQALRSAGVAAAVSGAGPSIVCLVRRGAEQAADDVFDRLEGWERLNVDWSSEGARIEEVPA